MSQKDLILQYGWLIALIVSIGVISWSILIIQALLHDKRIALIGVFASLLVAVVAVFDQLIPFVTWLKIIAALLCVTFMIIFLISNFRHPKIFLPVLGVVVCFAVGLWLFSLFQAVS